MSDGEKRVEKAPSTAPGARATEFSKVFTAPYGGGPRMLAGLGRHDGSEWLYVEGTGFDREGTGGKVTIHDVSDEEFDALMNEFCPDLKRQVGWFGDVGYGTTYWSSYTRFGVSGTLILRMAQRIASLEASK